MDLGPALVGEEAQGCGVLRLRYDRGPRAGLRIDAERRSQGPDQVAPADYVAERHLHTTKVVRAVGRNAFGEQPRHEIQLDAEPRARLQVVTAEEAGVAVKGVRLLDIAVDENVLPRDERVVEEQDRVVLVEAARQRMIEGADCLVLV